MSGRGRITRRSFLKKTAGVARGVIALPYIVSSSVLGKAGSVAASNRITLGFIGVGGHGRCAARGASEIYYLLFTANGADRGGKDWKRLIQKLSKRLKKDDI